MKRVIELLMRFLPEYKWSAVGMIVFSLISTIFSLFSFAIIVPILELLFKIRESVYVLMPLNTADADFFEAVKNNLYYYITQFMDSNGATKTIIILAIALISLTLIKVTTHYIGSVCGAKIQTGVVRDMRNILFSKILQLPMSYFSEEKKGDIMSKLSVDVNEVEASVMGSLDILVKNPLIIITYIIVMFTISLKLSIFMLVLLPISGFLIGQLGRNLRRDSLQASSETGVLNSQIEETLGGLRIIKAFNAENKIDSRFKNQTNKIRNAILKVVYKQYIAHPAGEFFGTVVIAALICFGGFLILSDNSDLDASVFIYYILIFYSIIAPVKELSRASYNIRKGSASLDRIDSILEIKNLLNTENSNNIDTLKDKIEYKNISFKYKNDWVLRNINLTINSGKTIALVGKSGSGKSTLVDLLPRFYDVNEGEILIDGINIKDTSLYNLRSLMGNVNQEAILFNDTFFNNITFGVDNATEQEVINAAKIANAHEFIIASENGYESNIGDRGCKLSGGQRQRISIARAILKNPPILILDEATSALDTESEKLVQQALENLMKNRTTIVIAHRLSTVRNADEICVLDEGKIVERGTHDELMQLNGIYNSLQLSQSLN